MSTYYSDLENSLSINADGTMKIVENLDSIKQSIVTILSTSTGERIMFPQFGSGIRRLLFEPLDEITASLIQSEIGTTLYKWEDRIVINNLEVTPDYDNNRYVLLLDYRILGINKIDQFVTGIKPK